MDGGEAVEIGAPQELLDRHDSRFRRMVAQLQQTEAEEKEEEEKEEEREEEREEEKEEEREEEKEEEREEEKEEGGGIECDNHVHECNESVV